MVDLAVELINRKSGKFKPDEFENHYVTALKKLVEKKMKGQKIIAPHEETAPRGKVVDLMAALKKSIGEVRQKGRSDRLGSRVGGRRRDGAAAERKTPIALKVANTRGHKPTSSIGRSGTSGSFVPTGVTTLGDAKGAGSAMARGAGLRAGWQNAHA